MTDEEIKEEPNQLEDTLLTSISLFLKADNGLMRALQEQELPARIKQEMQHALDLYDSYAAWGNYYFSLQRKGE